jgi:hypothetical protein
MGEKIENSFLGKELCPMGEMVRTPHLFVVNLASTFEFAGKVFARAICIGCGKPSAKLLKNQRASVTKE